MYVFSDSRVEGIAVDFMSRLLFYTDSGNDNIVMLTLDGTQEKIVVNSSLSEPKAIELDSINGQVDYKFSWITKYCGILIALSL